MMGQIGALSGRLFGPSYAGSAARIGVVVWHGMPFGVVQPARSIDAAVLWVKVSVAAS
jgi:hypothetical protein